MQTTIRRNWAFSCPPGTLASAPRAALLLLYLLAVASMPVCAQIAFQAQPALVTGPSPVSIAAGDFNGDGKLDVAIAANGNNDIYIYTGTGDGLLHYASYRKLSYPPLAIVTANFRHSNLDLVVGLDTSASGVLAGAVDTLLGNGDGTFQPEALHQTVAIDSSAAYSVAVDDFDQDGYADIVVTNTSNTAGSGLNGGVSVLFGYGNGGFTSPATYDPKAYPYAVVSADFDGDGVPDLAVVDIDYVTVNILLNNGNGQFSQAPPCVIDNGGFPRALAVGDFNGDSHLDLAVVVDNYAYNEIWIFSGDGHGGFGPPSKISAPAAFQVAAADFDGDGILDLLASAGFGGQITVFRGLGLGSFAAGQSISVGQGPNSTVVGDFNADGKPDLAVADNYSHSVIVFLNVSIPTDRVFSNNFE